MVGGSTNRQSPNFSLLRAVIHLSARSSKSHAVKRGCETTNVVFPRAERYLNKQDLFYY